MECLSEEMLLLLKDKQPISEKVCWLRENPGIIPDLILMIRTDKGTAKFQCEKLLRTLSEENPEFVYPYFCDIAELTDSPNNFIKWGSIITLSNLVSVDKDLLFENIYDRYFSLLRSESMITAANIASNVWKIILYYPHFESDITNRLLNIGENTYFIKGDPSPECKNIMYGHVLDAFDRYFEHSTSQKKMMEFASRQRNNPRKSVAKKAQRFLCKHTL